MRVDPTEGYNCPLGSNNFLCLRAHHCLGLHVLMFLSKRPSNPYYKKIRIISLSSLEYSAFVLI